LNNLSSDSSKTQDVEVLKIRCNKCNARIILNNHTPLAKSSCPECNEVFIVPLKLDNILIENAIYDNGRVALYRGVDLKLNRQILVKIINPELVVEGSLTLGLGSFMNPGVPSTYKIELIDDQLIQVIEYIHGFPLAHHMKQGNLLDTNSLINVIKESLDILIDAYNAKVKHGNLTLETIWICDKGNVKISDFMLYQNLCQPSPNSEKLTQVLDIQYASNSRLQNFTLTEEDDLYSFAVCIYKLCTGISPFESTSIAELLVERAENPPDAPHEIVKDVPVELSELVMSILSGKSELKTFSDLKDELFHEESASTEVAPLAVKVTKKEVKVNIKASTPAPIVVPTANGERPVNRSGANKSVEVLKLRNKLFVSRLFFVLFALLSLIFMLSRYMPESKIGNLSETLLNKSLDKLFAPIAKKDPFDVDSILKPQISEKETN
jgi:serine/threonine protein kinase